MFRMMIGTLLALLVMIMPTVAFAGRLLTGGPA